MIKQLIKIKDVFQIQLTTAFTIYFCETNITGPSHMILGKNCSGKISCKDEGMVFNAKT
jgi:hypothetical protein